MTKARDDLRDLIDVGVGRALLGACALALVITTCLPVTRWETGLEHLIDDPLDFSPEPLASPDGPLIYELNLWDLAGEGVGQALAVAIPLLILAGLCVLAVVVPSRITWVAPGGVVLAVWIGLQIMSGFPGADTAGRGLCLLVPLLTVAVGVWTERAHRRSLGRPWPPRILG